ncbi:MULTISPECIES: cold-shock protein [unclassified Acinetobacter]|uniref:cold-shock protein n=1 Tax=unclassified Acinetobacter TaxID=196816 RepID=UPI0029342D7C|nr:MULTISPECIES: cold shock domain-containing protein [unclassified Acinetobacter]WOE32831.1 cold shock domain-containing protein [Acinetobacter sp. SAAs470]WOE38308.1 cold shock domain-containing protein [Acinetobacter sp. SAAs474]
MKTEFQQGKVKQYHPDKGFGFLALAGHPDIFFHISDFPSEQGEPKRNERVKFLLEANGQKFKAIKIERVESHSYKAKKAKTYAHNTSITSALLGSFRGK